jgi:hypothetical protein
MGPDTREGGQRGRRAAAACLGPAIDAHPRLLRLNGELVNRIALLALLVALLPFEAAAARRRPPVDAEAEARWLRWSEEAPPRWAEREAAARARREAQARFRGGELSLGNVRPGLRLLQDRGIVAHERGRYRLALSTMPSVVRTLRRRHFVYGKE